MLELIVFVIFLVAVTYAWNATSAKGGKRRRSFNGRQDNPFRGRHTNPPPKSPNLTIDKGAMIRCHNCSCFFPEGKVVRDVVEGHILEFCSVNCKNNFLNPTRA